MKKFEITNVSGIHVIKPKSIAAAFMISLIFRLLLFNYYLIKNPDCFFDFWDAYLYVHDAKLFLNLGVFGDPPYPGIFRTPFYIIFVAAVFYLTNYSNTAVILLQIILSSITGAIVYIMSARLASEKAALFVSAVFAVDVLSITYANRIMSEIPFTFTVMLMAFLFAIFLNTGKNIYLALSGLAAGTAVLIRPILFYFPAVLPVIFILYHRKQFKKVVIGCFIFSICFYSIAGAWLIRNYSVGYHGIAAVQEFNIYMYKAGWIDEKLKGKSWPASINFDERFARIDRAIEERGMENTPYNRVLLYRELGMQTIKKNPLLLAQYQLFYTARVFLKSGAAIIYEKFPEETRGEGIRFYGRLLSCSYTAVLAIIYMLLLIGLFSQKSWRRTDAGPFIIVLFLYITILSGELGGEARFRIPLIPLMLIIASNGAQAALSLFVTGFGLIKQKKVKKSEQQ